MTTWQAATALFLVMDPVGNIPFFLAHLRPVARDNIAVAADRDRD